MKTVIRCLQKFAWNIKFQVFRRPFTILRIGRTDFGHILPLFIDMAIQPFFGSGAQIMLKMINLQLFILLGSYSDYTRSSPISQKKTETEICFD